MVCRMHDYEPRRLMIPQVPNGARSFASYADAGSHRKSPSQLLPSHEGATPGLPAGQLHYLAILKISSAVIWDCSRWGT